MRVLHILGELKPSGAELMYRAAAERWRAQGLECDILAIGDAPGVLAPQLEAAGYRIHHLPFERSAGHVWRVFRFLRRQRYDAVHVDGERACFWYSSAAYLAGTRRLFRTIHNVFPFRGALRLRRRLQRRLLRALGVRMIAISPSVEATEMRTFANPTVLIPNWFDDRVYVPPSGEQRLRARRRFHLGGSTVVFSTVAGCWSYKNHAAILGALAELPRDLDIVYLHAGMEEDGAPERRLASRLGIEERVRFLGVVPEVLPVLHASDGYLMPSLYEGFGCAAIEAMGAGLPVILSDVPGLRDFAGVCPGIRWTGTTPGSIAAAMLELARTPPGERRNTGLRLSDAVHRRFAMSNGAAAYARLYAGAEPFGGESPAPVDGAPPAPLHPTTAACERRAGQCRCDIP